MTNTSGQLQENKRLNRIALFGNLFVFVLFASILTIDYNHNRKLFAPPNGMVVFTPVQRNVENPGAEMVNAPELMSDTYINAVVQVLQKDGVGYERHGTTLYISADYAKNRDQIAAISDKAKNFLEDQKFGALSD